MPADTTSRRSIPYVLWGFGLLAALLVVVSIRYLTRERVMVRTARATFQDLVKASSANGKVQPIEDFQAHAQTSGVVERVYVTVGEKVQAGQLLLKMDDADAAARVASSQSALRAAELAAGDIQHGGTQDERNTFASDLTRAQLQQRQDATALASLQKLQKTGAASASEVASAEERLRLDEASLHSVQQHSTQRYGDADRAGARAHLDDARAALAAAQSSLASVNIRTPLAGTVYSIPVSQYDYIPAGDDLIYVSDLNRIQVLAYFDEPEIGNLAVGQQVKIVWDAKPGKAWHGHITVAPTSIITYGTRNVGECYITVDDARGDLLPNSNVTVTVTTAQHPHVLSVPHEALHNDGGQDYVYRIVDSKLKRTPVTVGFVTLTRVEIVSGLKENDLVALSPTTNRELSDGLEVTPVP